MTLTTPCPCCHRPLHSRQRRDDEFVVWCANGPCHSEVAGYGVSDYDEQAAVNRLVNNVNEELAMMEDMHL